MADKQAKLARDKGRSTMQITSYDTSNAFDIIGGGDSEVFPSGRIVRIVNIGTTVVRIEVNATAVTGVGMPLLIGSELHMLIPEGEYISFIDGDVSVTPIGA